jgi:hypothetical protein
MSRDLIIRKTKKLEFWHILQKIIMCLFKFSARVIFWGYVKTITNFKKTEQRKTFA